MPYIPRRSKLPRLLLPGPIMIPCISISIFVGGNPGAFDFKTRGYRAKFYFDFQGPIDFVGHFMGVPGRKGRFCIFKIIRKMCTE